MLAWSRRLMRSRRSSKEPCSRSVGTLLPATGQFCCHLISLSGHTVLPALTYPQDGELAPLLTREHKVKDGIIALYGDGIESLAFLLEFLACRDGQAGVLQRFINLAAASADEDARGDILQQRHPAGSRNSGDVPHNKRGDRRNVDDNRLIGTVLRNGTLGVENGRRANEGSYPVCAEYLGGCMRGGKRGIVIVRHLRAGVPTVLRL